MTGSRDVSAASDYCEPAGPCEIECVDGCKDRAAAQSLLMRHKETEDGIVTFTDELPPFGVLQMADVTWESIGSPDEVLVTVTPTSGAVRVA